MMATELDPLNGSAAQRSTEYARRRKRKRLNCWLGIIAVVCGTTVVISAFTTYFAYGSKSDRTIPNGTAPFNSSFMFLRQSWPVEDETRQSRPQKYKLSLITITDAVADSFLMSKKKQKLEEQMLHKNITIKPNTPEHYHQKFAGCSPRAAQLAKEGYTMNVLAASLAKRIKLDKTESAEVLNSIDKTMLNSACQALSNTTCPEEFFKTDNIICNKDEPYRREDGSCNNLLHPYWGTAFSTYRRMMLPDYADGIYKPRIGKDGEELPSARLVSSTLHPSNYHKDSKHTAMLMNWGQFVDHDITATALSKGMDGSGISCCGVEELHPECFPISIPSTDPFYQDFNKTCMEMVRSAPAATLGFRNQINQLTSFIDGSTIYGSTKDELRSLRSFTNGTLKFTLAPNNVVLLPLQKEIKQVRMKNILNVEKNMLLGTNQFKSGDSRVNEQIMLTAMHTIWMREHNRVARKLIELNPHWDDEKLFQESRKIVNAEIQHITYNEYLPEILGKKMTETLGLNPQKNGHSDNYSHTINPTIANAFAAAAYRFGHSQVQGLVRFMNPNGRYEALKQLHTLFFNPWTIFHRSHLDELVYGQLKTETRVVDTYFTEQLTNHLFEKGKTHYGLDLVSINIQRGRDHGLPSYNSWRKHCNLPVAISFKHLSRFGWSDDTIKAAASIYKSVDDIDVYSGGLNEDHIDGGVVGATFACIIGDQFLRLKRGDRYWYETSLKPQAFTSAQLKQIRRTTMSRILCDNVDELLSVTQRVFLVESSNNPSSRCYSNKIPEIDFRYWQESIFY